MLELQGYAREGPLRAFFSEPPFWFSPENGVVGIALSYDEDLVREIEDSTYTSFSRGTVERSALVARSLAIITGTSRFSGGPSVEPSLESIQYVVFERWRVSSYRRYERQVSPVVIEVTVGPNFPTEPIRFRDTPRSFPFLFFSDHRIVYRRIEHSVLHYAESGGRITAQQTRRWGTLGGFLENLDSQLFATSAAHVLEGSTYAKGTPAFKGAEVQAVRSVLQKMPILGTLAPRWGREVGEHYAVSPPEIVPRYQCSFDRNPQVPGLDVALTKWPTPSMRMRRTVDLGAPGQVSQVLPSYFWGAASGLKHVYVSSLSIWHSYELPGTDQAACVSNCLQIKLRDRPYFRTNVSRGGDSGAWLMADGLNGPVWLGLVVGGDGDRAGVVPASRIVSYFEPRLGPLQPRLS